MILIVLLLILSFMVGYAIHRGSICAVMATHALIVDRRSDRFRALGIAAAGAGAVIVPLHWLLPDDVALSSGYPITLTVVLAGGVFGLGVRINNACVLGTLSYLTGGNLTFALSILGIILGVHGAAAVDGSWVGLHEPSASFLDMPSIAAVVFVIALAVSLAAALYRRIPRWVRGWSNRGSTTMGPYQAMLIIGISGGLLYALAGEWTDMSVLSRRAARLIDPSLPEDGWLAFICAVAVIVGGVVAAVRYGTFKLQFPHPMSALRCLAGGTIMGASAAIIPGGNGTMLVYGLPSLAPHAVGAYLAMTIALVLSFLHQRQRNKT
ncbi:MAG: YeeE/YedE family protein [Rhizobiales bacterium]|nr:YeeE/YedE family protein [Hyphomicrobiales bacterium]